MSKYRDFSGLYFAVFGLNTGKYGPEKTLYLDTFHAVYGSSYHIVPAYVMSDKFHLFYKKQTMTSSRTCVNHAHAFFCTCGQFIIKRNRMEIDDFYKKAYFAYFKVKLGDQDKPWAPHYVCNTCQWTNRKRKSISFVIPMILRAPSSHHDDCYFL